MLILRLILISLLVSISYVCYINIGLDNIIHLQNLIPLSLLLILSSYYLYHQITGQKASSPLSSSLPSTPSPITEEATEIFNTIAHPILIVNIKGRIIFANKAALDRFGYTLAQIILHSIDNLLLENNYETITDYLDDCISEQESLSNIKTFAQCQDHALFSVTLGIKPFNTNNQQYATISVLETNTQELEEERLQLQLLSVEQASDALFWLGKNGQVLYANETACQMLGYSTLELSLLSIESLIHHIELSSWQQIFRIAKECGSCVFEAEIQTQNKQYVPIEMVINYAALNNNEYMCAYMRNISNRKQEDLQLQEYAQKLERKNQELEQFTYIASHNLQEPLRMISSFVQLLQIRYKNKLDQDADEYINFTVEGVKRMKDLLKDLSYYANLSYQSKHYKNISLTKSIETSIYNLKNIINKNDVTIKFDNNLPEIYGDEKEIILLFENLISNAIRYKSDKAPEITIKKTQNDVFWVFSIHDNGIGIDKEYRKKIFRMFNRLNLQNDNGTGMGLSICQKIIEKHGGQIWHEPNPLNNGSIFYFTLPLVQKRKKATTSDKQEVHKNNQ